MHLAIFGATGGTGRQLTEQALQAGHAVTALVRDPAKLALTHPALTVIGGNVLDETAVANTLARAAAVCVTLGNTANNPDLIVSKGTAVVLKGMAAAGIKRLVVISCYLKCMQIYAPTYLPSDLT